MSLPNAEPQEHLDSYPFLSGDTLRAFADVVFERKVRYLYVATHNTWTVRPNNRWRSYFCASSSSTRTGWGLFSATLANFVS